ncbi:hypothetical protein CMUS01_03975 [Colletotrichum musicola]|uniref:Uncharacterized protein n=1 Tax=Colletotrichum musicola TaxID=2175873 RepID=A0A8H6U4T2_9PEZI|nr:hypothetical protein CMUS01_03975 [Colletotrichum musicola]
MASTAYYHAINAGGTEPPAEARNESATTHRLDLGDETDRETSSGGPLGSLVCPSHVSLSKDDDTSEVITLEPGFTNSEPAVLKTLSWFWDIVLTVSPLFFIVLAILAARLDGSPVANSKYGDKVVEITRLGPTIYPILFAMVAARFYKNAARYRLERPGGMRMSSLEQVFGSQSFASALERLVVVRAQLLLGALILSTWAMSPLGGQSSSRLLRIEERRVEVETLAVYYDNRAYMYPVWSDPDTYRYSASDIVQALYSGSLLSQKKQQRSFSDLWERPKIPQLPWNWTREENGEAWRVVDQDALEAGRDHFTSLIGLSVQSFDFSDISTRYDFKVQSSHFDFKCAMVADTDSEEVFGNLTFWQPKSLNHLNRVQTNLVEILPRYGNFSYAYESFATLLVYPTEVEPVPYLLYASFAAPTGGPGMFQDLHYSAFNCTMAMPNVETEMSCTAQGCSPVRQRQVMDANEDVLVQFRRWAYIENALAAWPNMTKSVPGKASATENFIANDENVYANQKLRIWTGTDEKTFSSRLTTAFNTAWEAGVNPYNITKGSTFTTSALSPDEYWANQTSAVVSRDEKAYYLNVSWAVTLTLATVVLQALAVGGLVLRFLIRGPDILGFASSLTRDNRFVPVKGGSALDGADRAKSLREMRVRIADVQPQESCGYVAFSTIPEDGGSKEGEVAFRPLEKKRLYK